MEFLSRCLAPLLLGLLLAGCSTEYVEGRYACTPRADGQCPPDWFCHPSDRRCYSYPPDAAGPDADADGDADGDDDGAADLEADLDDGEPDVPTDGDDGDGFVPCSGDSCDDLDPCNGTETCLVSGLCQAGTPQVDYTECTTGGGTSGACLASRCDPTLQEVSIPAGVFRRGDPAALPGAPDQPLHEVTLTQPFRIDRYEVTNARYRACVAAGICRVPASADSHTRDPYYGEPAYDQYPVVEVSWDDAVDFCTWLGRRLPTEAEWELAARGDCTRAAPTTCGPEDDGPYPWGAELATCDLANHAEPSTGYCVVDGDTDRVGSRTDGAGPYGVHDLAGNVAEWVADLYDPTYYLTTCALGCVDPEGPAAGSERVVRGGSWSDGPEKLEVSERASLAPGARDDGTGFRCARDEP